MPSPAITEAVLIVAILTMACLNPTLCDNWFARVEILFRRIAQRRALSILLVATTPLLLRAALMPFSSTPEPRVHDEFSYLLAADTFVRGRLTNPPHPMWIHFETMQVLVQPTYQSIYPIGQGLALALGRAVFGHPWAGVWISVAAMGAALCWMLQGWMPPGWALLGAMLAMLRLGVISYWMNSYWGGAVAATGGALLFGALPRILRCSRTGQRCWRDALVLALGLAILANSRPYEGFVVSLPAAFFLFAWIFSSQGPPKSLALRQIVLPILLTLAITAGCMCYYFARVTGDPFLMPYVLSRNNLEVSPHFIWQTPRSEPVYHHRAIRDFYAGWEMAEYYNARKLVPGLLEKLQSYWRFFIGPLLSIPLLAFPWRSKDQRARILLWSALAFSVGLAVEVWHNLHYAAPGVALCFAIIALGLERLYRWEWRGKASGRFIVRALPLACLLALVARACFGPERFGWEWRSHGNHNRARIVKELTNAGGKHLILVRYREGHDPGDEWVYNEADIDGSPVVWARDMDRANNDGLLRYFQGRQVWLLEPDLDPPHLTPARQYN